MKRIGKFQSVLLIFCFSIVYIIQIAYAQTAGQGRGVEVGYKYGAIIGVIVGLLFFCKSLFKKKK